MSLHIVGNPRDYGGDDEPPEHGRDTAVFQELQPIINEYRNWLRTYGHELFNDEMISVAHLISEKLERLSDELNTPL